MKLISAWGIEIRYPPSSTPLDERNFRLCICTTPVTAFVQHENLIYAGNCIVLRNSDDSISCVCNKTAIGPNIEVGL